MKKSFALLLALAMIIALFAGCGSSTASNAEPAASAESAAAPAESVAEEPEEEAAPADEAEPAEASEPAAEEPEEEAEPAYTLEYPLVDEPITLTYWQAWPPFLSEISDPSDAATFDALEEMTGIHLEIIAVSTENDANDFMLRAASGDLTDLIQKGADHYTGGGDKAIEDDILIDLLPLLEENMPDYWKIMSTDETFYKTVVTDQGQVPALIGMYKDPYYTDQGMWIRQDALDQVGKSVPTTLDELEDVLASFQDMGMSDPLVVLSEGNCDLLTRAYEADDHLVDGKIVSGALTNGKDVMLKLHEYYEKGFINVDFVSYNWSNTKPPQDIVYSGDAGIFNEDVISVSTYVSNATIPGYDLQPMGQIRLTPDQELNTGYIGVYAADKYTVSVSATSDYPELALQYMNYLYTEDGITLTNWGIEGLTYEVVNGENQFTDLITNFEMGMQLAQSLYINPGLPCITDLSIQESTYTDAQKAAVPTWVAAFDSSEETMPNTNWLTYTDEETQRYYELYTDLNTYEEEMRLKFITGQADIEAEWDSYVSTCKSMGFDELQEITQAAVTRYLEK